MRIAVFTDEHDAWHSAQLAEAFATRGIQTQIVALSECRFDLSGTEPRVHIPGFSSLPHGVFVRGIAGGTLQQVITRLDILHFLEMLGVKVYNSGRAIERTVDKAMTTFLLAQAGIATPPTWVCESRQQAHELISQRLTKHPLVLKPLFGSQGKGLRLLQQSSRLPLPMDAFVDGVFYLQQFIETGTKSHDFRVFVVNDIAVAAMQRSGEGWLNNVAQGAHCAISEDKEVMQLAKLAAKALCIDYCGVDIMRDAQGKLWVLEVNSIPAWRGLQSVVKNNINQLVVDDLLSKIS